MRKLIKNNSHFSRRVDAFIRTAYSIMESWKNYLEGKTKKIRNRIRRRFASF
jgi:hypothetical protein